MIVCSCNQLTDRQVRDALTSDSDARPRSPGQVYLCLGCKPNCGRCVTQIRQMFSDITASHACQIGCATCPGESAVQAIAAQIPAAATNAPVIATPAAQPAFGQPASPVIGRRQFAVPAAQRFTQPAIPHTCASNGPHQHAPARRHGANDDHPALIAAE